MSHAATAWAFKIRGLSFIQRIVLYQLADRCNEGHEGFEGRSVCWPSIGRLVNDCEMARRSVFNVMDALESKSVLKRLTNHGYAQAKGNGGEANIYELMINIPADSFANRGADDDHDRPSEQAVNKQSGVSDKVVHTVHHPETDEKPQGGAYDNTKVVHTTTKGGAPYAPKPCKEPVKGKSKNARANLDRVEKKEFRELYDAYPRPMNPIPTKAAYDLARTDWSHDNLMASLKRWCGYWNTLPDSERKFIPYPENWLKRGQYAHEPSGETVKDVGEPRNLLPGAEPFVIEHGADTWNTWFADCKFTSDGNTLMIETDSAFKMDYMKSHFASCLIDAVGQPVEFAVRG